MCIVYATYTIFSVLLNAGHSAKFVMNIAAPSSFKIMKGRTVTVTCKVTCEFLFNFKDKLSPFRLFYLPL